MMVEKTIVDFFHSLSLGELRSMVPINNSGSTRQYFTIITDTDRYIATFSANIAENQSFLYFSKQFAGEHLPVPKVLGVNKEKTVYIQSYNGESCLLDRVLSGKYDGAEIVKMYQSVLQSLLKFQIDGGSAVDFSQCFASESFSERLILADLNYFRYYFVKLTGMIDDEYGLESDFYKLANCLKHNEEPYFMYRDFQARNIMLDNEQMCFIDYQGGMKGPLQYDIASLLYQAKAGLKEDERKCLLNFYLDELEKRMPVDRKEFEDRFYMILLLRILQTLGAYGFRGFIERKAHFIESIAPALRNLSNVKLQCTQLDEFPVLAKTIDIITDENNIKLICKKLN